MRRPALAAVAATAVCSAALATLATLGIAQGGQSEIFACVNAQGGMRVIAANSACADGETRLSWNKVGPQGPAGPAGRLDPQAALAIEEQLVSIQRAADAQKAGLPRLSADPERRLRALAKRLRARGILKPASTDERLIAMTPLTLLEDRKATVKAKLDSLSEMGEMESLRLQMAMDRLSKLVATLSNLLKKSSETAQAITQNLK